MKVLSGIYKGRKLLPPKDLKIRTTGAMVKEAVFGKLQFEIAGSGFLDLFGGSGAIGIEALSKNAEEVVIADSSAKAIKLIRDNLTRIDADCTVLQGDYKAILKQLQGRKFDFIYADPPYALEIIDDILDLAYEFDVIKVGGIVIYEHLREKVLNYKHNHYILMDEKHYSSVTVSYLKRT